MSPASLVFRFRVWIIPVLYLLGFLAPWEGTLFAHRSGTLWLAASALLAQTGWMSLAASSLLVTIAALSFCVIGAILRVWGAAYLGASVVVDSTMHGNAVLASGPYRYSRNPLYVGGYLFATGVAILMPPSGALFLMATLLFFYLTLVAAEEDFLSARQRDDYGSYRLRVPRFLPRFKPSQQPKPGESASPSNVRPSWLMAVASEICPIGFAICFAVFAWRYNALLLIKCLLICYGLSLIIRALLPRARTL